MAPISYRRHRFPPIEPSLPFGITAAARASMAVSDGDLARAQARNIASIRCPKYSDIVRRSGTESSLDSPLEGDGFEPSVPRQKDNAFRNIGIGIGIGVVA